MEQRIALPQWAARELLETGRVELQDREDGHTVIVETIDD